MTNKLENFHIPPFNEEPTDKQIVNRKPGSKIEVGTVMPNGEVFPKGSIASEFKKAVKETKELLKSKLRPKNFTEQNNKMVEQLFMNMDRAIERESRQEKEPQNLEQKIQEAVDDKNKLQKLYALVEENNQTATELTESANNQLLLMDLQDLIDLTQQRIDTYQILLEENK